MFLRKLSNSPSPQTISLEENQFINVEWKIKNIFEASFLEDRFQLGDGICQLCLGGSNKEGGVDEIFIAISMHELDHTYGKFRIRCFIEDTDGKPQFPCESTFDSAGTGSERVWFGKMKDCRKIEGALVADGVVTFILLFTPLETALWKTKPEIEHKSIETSLPVDPVISLENLSVDLGHLLDDGAHSDITLKCGNRTIAAHRAILSARSEVFSRMLRRDTSESRKGVISINDIDPSIVDQIIQHVYSGRIPYLSGNTAQQLYEAADKYGLESLKTQCSYFMEKNLTKENASSVLEECIPTVFE